MNEQITTYLRNPNLKASNVKVSFTQEQVEEYIKCGKDPVYFIEKYVQIVSLDKGLIPFNLWDFQRTMVDTFHDNRLRFVNYLDRVENLQQFLHIFYIIFCLIRL